MGIPYYFYNIIKNNPKTLIYELSSCQNIFLDFNSVIHQCSAKIIAQNPNYTIQDIQEEILNYTLHILSKVKPTNIIYIAVDGVAPRAKIQQQRKRRYLSASRRDITSSWDSNCITPGTDFMKNLDIYLKSDFSKKIKKIYTSCKVIISGHDEVGEGEHKMMKYLKKIDNAVIYGLDADLIMLSMIANTKIYLMRESTEFSANTPSSVEEFRYLDIEMLKSNIKIDIHDYIFICFMLGNDFIPNISFLKIKNNAIDILLQHYKSTYKELNTNLIKDTQINFEFLTKFIESLSNIEEDEFKNTLQKYNTETELYTKLMQKKWRLHYYKHLFGGSSHSPTFIRKVSLNYIEGLLWTFNYYFTDKYDQHWCYHFDYAPCVSDIFKYLITMDQQIFNDCQKNLQKHSTDYIHVHAQMLMVLPPQSKLLVPESIRIIYDSIEYGCVHYFPIKFNVSTFLKAQAWEHIPILPIVNLETIQKALIKCN
jgi:5'-3' exonuclease